MLRYPGGSRIKGKSPVFDKNVNSAFIRTVSKIQSGNFAGIG